MKFYGEKTPLDPEKTFSVFIFIKAHPSKPLICPYTNVCVFMIVYGAAVSGKFKKNTTGHYFILPMVYKAI